MQQSTLMRRLSHKKTNYYAVFMMTNHSNTGWYSLQTRSITAPIWWTYIPVWDDALVLALVQQGGLLFL